MRPIVAILTGFALFVVVSTVTLFSVGVGLYNDCIQQERGLVAQYGQNKNNYDNFRKKVQEVAQVPAMYTEDLKKVYDSAITGRYGKDGSKALFQFIQEHNPSFDGSIYKEVQQVIESGRNSFEADQKTLLDKRRVYEGTLRTFPNNIIVGFLGFPKIDLAKYDIVTSDETEKDFESKRSDGLKLR